MNELDQVQASGDTLPGIIWLIFLAIWALGKFLQRLMPSGSEAQPSQQGPSPSSLERELRDFIETVTGETLEDAPKTVRPRPQPAPLPPPIAPPRVSSVPTATQRAPAAPMGTISPPKLRPEAKPYKPLGQDSGIEDQLELLPPPELHGSHKYMLVGSKGLSLKMQGMRLPDTEREANATIRYSIPNRAALKRAMIDRIVLGPPRGISDFVQEDLQKTK